MAEQSSDDSARAPSKVQRGALWALIGAAALIVAPFTASHEGERHVAYLDPAKVWTICDGDTTDVRPGQRSDHAECMVRLDRQLAAHAQPVLRCTPGLKGHPYQIAAAIDLAYNIGGPAYCGSTVARRFNAGDWRGACDAMLAWVYAKGRKLPGLVKRRQDERALCLTDLPNH